MNHLSIRTKLYSITAMVAVVLLILGGLGIYALKNVNDKAAEISDVWLIRVKTSGDINLLTSDYRSMQYNHLVSPTRERKAAAEASMDKLNAQLEEKLKSYEANAREELKGEIRKTHADWNMYTKESREVFRVLSNVGKTEEAGAVLQTTAKDTYDAVTAKITELGNASMQGAKDASAESAEIYDSTAKMLVLVIAIALIVTLVSLLFLTTRIVGGIATILEAAERVADGDLKGKAQVTSGDEIGRLGQATNKMIANLRDLLQQIQKTSSQVAASSEELTASADQSSEVTQTIAASVTTVAEMSSNQVATVNTTSSVVEEMSAGIEETAATIGIAAEQSSKALETAKEGNQAIEKAIGQMNNIELTVNKSAEVVEKLGERSKEIGQIVETISGIAGQTNLLALNAAIEAARAGEQGKGFAVVAEEVRKLAEQSQDAAKQIGELITEIQQDTDRAVIAMQEGTKEVKVGTDVVTSAGGAFVKILEMVTAVNGQSNDIAATMEELASGTQQIVNSVQAIDQSGKQVAAEAESVSAATQQQSASMEEIAAASRNLSSLAEQMELAAGKFKL